MTANAGNPKYHPDCTCTKDHTGQICTTAGFDIPPSFQAVTAEYIQDISGEQEEMFYLTTQDMYRLHRYFGLWIGRLVGHDCRRTGDREVTGSTLTSPL